jgi:hypothetical protein
LIYLYHSLISSSSTGTGQTLITPKKPVNEYAQQQSQIFVYPTNLANKAAEAVDNGEFDSIIDFHCAQEETKKILGKLTDIIIFTFFLSSKSAERSYISYKIDNNT